MAFIGLIDLKSVFSGRWIVSRTSNNMPFFEGEAIFTQLGVNFLHYFEEGKVIYPNGFETTSYQNYYFELKGNAFSVFFDESKMRLFHHIELKQNGHEYFGAASHLCINDLYDSSYNFIHEDNWSLHHKVQGPRKDYKLVTLYTR